MSLKLEAHGNIHKTSLFSDRALIAIADADAMRQVPTERHIDMAINSPFLVKVEQAIYQN